MILSDSTINQHLATGRLVIDPLDAHAQVQPASVDLTLGPEFLFMTGGGLPGETGTIDPREQRDDLFLSAPVSEGGSCILFPGTFALASTVERVRLADNLVGRVDGKSSLGRIGLMVHSTAGFIDPGFTGTITLELSNVGARPIRLQPGMRICQVSFMILDRNAARPYGHAGLNSKYQDQDGPVASRYHANMP